MRVCRTSLAALLLVACTAKPAPVVREIEGEPEVIELGERRPGDLKWMSANARFVALYLYPDRRSIERLTVPPVLLLFDTVEGTRRVVEEVVATDPRGRWAVVLAGKHLWLLDAETGARDDLAARGADLTGDRMRCWGGRQAAFDPWGAELLYLRTDPDRAVIRRLRDGAERELAAPPYKLWRAELTGVPGWVRFLVVPRDTDGDGALSFPWRGYPCEAWVDYSGWHDLNLNGSPRHGDRAAVVLVHADGTRVHSGFGAEPEPMEEESGQVWEPFDRDAFGLHAVSNVVVRMDGTRVPAPEGCEWSKTYELPVATMKCAEGVRLVGSVVGGTRTMPGLEELFMRPALGHDGALWSAAWMQVDGEERLARINLADGSFELDRNGVLFDRHGVQQDRRGWLYGSTGGWTGPERFAYHVPTGRVRRLPGFQFDSDGALGERDDRFFAIDLEGARMLHVADRRATVAENGCALVAPDTEEPAVAGSWALLCPPGRSLRLDRGE